MVHHRITFSAFAGSFMFALATAGFAPDAQAAQTIDDLYTRPGPAGFGGASFCYAYDPDHVPAGASSAVPCYLPAALPDSAAIPDYVVFFPASFAPGQSGPSSPSPVVTFGVGSSLSDITDSVDYPYVYASASPDKNAVSAAATLAEQRQVIDDSPPVAASLLGHLASYGFVVVASTNGNQDANLNGTEATCGLNYMMKGADLMAAMASDAANVSAPGMVSFYGRLDTSNVAAVGHSQGASAAGWATIWSNLAACAGTHTRIKTLVTIEPPGDRWTCNGVFDLLPGASVSPCGTAIAPQKLDARDLISSSGDTLDAGYVSAFWIDGSEDTVVSPPTQFPSWTPLAPNWAPDENSVAAFYQATSSSPEARATMQGANHNDVLNCSPESSASNYVAACSGIGADKYFGYITAWLRWQLANDSLAAQAFVGLFPEITGNGAWTDAATSDLHYSVAP